MKSNVTIMNVMAITLAITLAACGKGTSKGTDDNGKPTCSFHVDAEKNVGDGNLVTTHYEGLNSLCDAVFSTSGKMTYRLEMLSRRDDIRTPLVGITLEGIETFNPNIDLGDRNVVKKTGNKYVLDGKFDNGENADKYALPLSRKPNSIDISVKIDFEKEGGRDIPLDFLVTLGVE